MTDMGSPVNMKDDKLPKAPISAQLAAKLEAKNVTLPEAQGQAHEPFSQEPEPPATPPRGEGGRFVSDKPATDAGAPGTTDATDGATAATDGVKALVAKAAAKTDAAATADTSGASSAPRVVNDVKGAAKLVEGAAPDKGAATDGAQTGADDYDDVEVEDDFGKNIKIRVPKDQAKWAKDGFLRRSDYTRKTQALSKFRPLLEPLILDGRMENVVAPLIERATTDAKFAEAVVALYHQAYNGQPLSYGVAPAAAAAPAAADVQMPDMAGIIAAASGEDPYVGGILEKTLPQILGPLIQQNAALAAKVQSITDTSAQAQQRQEEQTRLRQAQATMADQTYAAFTQRWPQQFGADRQKDFGYLSDLFKYADSMGYVKSEGYIPGMLHAHYDALERAANDPATPSAAAKTLDDVERQSRELAQQSANSVASRTQTVRTAAGDAGAPQPVKVRTKDDQGRPLPIKQITAAVVAAAQQNARR